MSFLATFIMRGRLQAITVAASLMLLSLVMPPLIKPIAIIVSFAAISLVTLRKGGTEGLYTLLLASVAYALLSALLLWEISFAVIMLVSSLMMWLPVWVIAIVLRETRHLNLAIEVSILLGVVGVIGFYLYATDPAAIWKQLFAPFLEILPGDAPVDDIRHIVDVSSHYMTGAVAASIIFSILFGLFLGRWWQSVLYNPGGFKQEFLSLSTRPRLAVCALVIVGIASASSGMISEVAWNVTILLFVLYTYIGTAVMHTVFAAMKIARFAVPMFYITLLLIPHIMLPVSLVGLSDAWLNLRKIKPNQT